MLKVPDAAEMLNISPDSVYELVHRGELPAVHLGRNIRIPVFGLKTWIAHQAGVEPVPAQATPPRDQQH
jgi:excisionase family DNA binding protein